MSFADWSGSVGVFLLLLAFTLQLLGYLKSTSPVYLLMNLVGAGLACLASILILFWPFVVLEGTWAVVAGWQLLRVGKRP